MDSQHKLASLTPVYMRCRGQARCTNRNAAPSREALLRQAADLQRQQEELQGKLAELADLMQDLSEEERAELQQHIQHADAGLAATGQQVQTWRSSSLHCSFAGHHSTARASAGWCTC